MPQRIICRVLTLSALAVVSSIAALAQTQSSREAPASVTSNSWQSAQMVGFQRVRLIVVTLDQPHSRQTCHIQSFTVDKLICSRAMGGSRIYLPGQVVALILPGDGKWKLELLIGLNAGLGAAIWGTVVFAPICPACAVATGIAALVLFGAAVAIAIGDDRPDRLLYLAPGRHLTGKLGSVQL